MCPGGARSWAELYIYFALNAASIINGLQLFNAGRVALQVKAGQIDAIGTGLEGFGDS